MALVIRKYAEGNTIKLEEPAVEEVVQETLEPFQPVENPSVQAAMVPQLKYVIHRGVNEYDPAAVRDYITNDYNLKAWGHNRGLSEVELTKFLQAVQDMLVSGIDAGTLDFLNENAITVPEQFAGDGNYNTKDTLGGQKVITDDDKAARIEAVNYLKSAFSHGYIQPKVSKLAFNADRIIMQALAEKVGNGSMAALLSVWSGLSPLERLRMLRDTLNHLDYLKIFENYDFSNTDVKNAKELHNRIQALQASFTGGDLTNDNYTAAGKAGISILKDLIYGREKRSTPSSSSSGNSSSEDELQRQAEEWRATGMYTEELILNMINAERERMRKEADFRYDININGEAYEALDREIIDLGLNSSSVMGKKQTRYEPDELNDAKGLSIDIQNPKTNIGALAVRLTGTNGLLERNNIISDIISRGGNKASDKETVSNLMYIMRTTYGSDGYICFGYFPNLGKIVYGDLANLTITTSDLGLSGECKNSSDLEDAKRQFVAHKHSNLNYDNYLKYKDKKTRVASTSDEGLYKEGGIIKAQTGAQLGSLGNLVEGARNIKDTNYEKRKLTAVENGMSEDMFDAKNKELNSIKDLEGYDLARIGSIASDLAALAASFVPGYGTAASGGLSLLSTVLDLGADITDPAVSGWDAAKNAGINLGMGVVGLLPGGKTASVGAKLAKSAKVLTRGLVALGMYDGARLLNDVIERGNKYGWDTITKDDWINLTRSLSNLSNGTAATVRGTKLAMAKRTVNLNGMTRTFNTDKIVIEGNFKGTDGKSLKKIELDSVNDKNLIDLLNAAPDNAARLELLKTNGKISLDSSNKIKLLDDRSFYKRAMSSITGKEVEATDSNWNYRETGTSQRIMNWDELVESNPTLKKAILEKNGSDVLEALNSKEIKRYLRVLAIENPTSYRKATADIKFMKSVATKSPTSKFRDTLDSLSLDEASALIKSASATKINWANPASWQRRINESWFARPFVNETPYEGVWQATRSTGEQMFTSNHSDYRRDWSNTPLSLRPAPTNLSVQNPVNPAPTTTPKPASMFTPEILLKFNEKFGENGEKINTKTKQKLAALRNKIKEAVEKTGGTFKEEDYSDQILLTEVLEHYIRNSKQAHTATTGTPKSSLDILKELLDKNSLQFWNTVYRNIDKLTKSFGQMSIFRLGGQFARNTVKKYQKGSLFVRDSNTQKANQKGWELKNWEEIVNNIGIENFLNDLYGEDGSKITDNLNTYNNYNNEFFNLRTNLYGNEGFVENSPFRQYNPGNYNRGTFNSSKFGTSLNSTFNGPNARKDDVEDKYSDNWWGTLLDVRHYGANNNQKYVLDLINAKLEEWSKSNDPTLKAKAEALKGLSANTGEKGGLQYSLLTNPSDNGNSPTTSETPQLSELDKFLAQGNDVERTPKDTYKQRIDWGNIGELYRLWLANRTNDKLRDSYKKDKVDLESPAYKQGTIASTYAIENANNNASNRVLAQLQNGPLYSDAALNTAALLNAYELILKTEATNNATRDKYYQENVNANQEIANYNRAAGVTTANKNREALVKWYNDYLDHMRDLDVEDFNNRDRWMAGLIQQWAQKRALENNLNYQNYALNADYNNVLYRLGLNNVLTQTIQDEANRIRQEGKKLGYTDEQIEETINNSPYIAQEMQKAKLAMITHDIQTKYGMNDSMLYGTSHSGPYWQTDVYNTRQMPTWWNGYKEIQWATPPYVPTTKVTTNKRGGKVEYTEDKARKKLFDIMGLEYLDMLKRNSKYVLHKK